MVASIKPNRDEIGLSDGLLLIEGTWAAAQSGESWSHSHPATGEEVASFPIAGPQDVDAAVRAARRAFDEGPWPRARAAERIRVPPRRVTWTGHLPRTRMTRVGYRRAGGSGIARSESLWSGCKTRGSPWRSAVKQEATKVPHARFRLNLQPSGWRARQTLEPHAAFGGFGQLGMGREGGRTVIAAYTKVKTMTLPFTNEMI